MISMLASWHPVVVHFAVALTVTSFFFDLTGATTRFTQFATTGFHLMVTAVPFLLLAVITGNLAEGMFPSTEARTLIDQHLTLMNAAVWGFMAIAAWRIYATANRKFTRASMFFYLAVLFLVCVAVFIGALEGAALCHAQ
ncbi:MAG: hypothetical protein GXO82_11105 [Chlorobi bacterium]|nr:hypothetical protein [Chlorobiota bacterium]